MTSSRRLLILGGALLAVLGMTYGLYYALFVEHKTLDRMGGSLAQAFSAAAARDASSPEALRQYRETKYDYIRQVDAHSHWLGLAMLMIVLGVLFDRVNFSERNRQALASCLLAGSAIFPSAVLLQTLYHDNFVFKVLAVAGSGLVMAGLAATAWGLARARTLESPGE